MNTAEAKVTELTTYNFSVKLEYLDEYKKENSDNCYCVPFQVLAKDGFEAQRILEEWLSNPKQTGYKYKTWNVTIFNWFMIAIASMALLISVIAVCMSLVKCCERKRVKKALERVVE